MINSHTCGTCAHSHQLGGAVGVRLGCWKDREASGFRYTFNLPHDGADCDTFKLRAAPQPQEQP